jgi:hypothetical protein
MNGGKFNNENENDEHGNQKYGFNQWAVYILKELERQVKEDEKQQTEHENLKTEQIKQGKQIARLEVKAGLWGIIGGIATIVFYIALEYLKKGI